MRVLVTGGGGFLGKTICKQLKARGHQVLAFNRQKYPALDAMGIEQFAGDLRNLDMVAAAAEGCEAIVHTAAKAGAWGSLADYYESNVRGTDHVLAACELHRIDKLVYTSSPSVIHGGEDLNGVNESAPYAKRYLAPYPQTKALAEQRVLKANSPQLATVVLRPHLIWGVGDPHLLPRILDRARKGRLRHIGEVSKKIDTVHVDNAAEAHVLALEKLKIGSSIAGKVYFITNGEPVMQDAIINSLLKAGGFPPETRRMPLGPAQFLATVMETTYRLFGIKREPPLTRFIVEQLSTAHWFNIAAARRDLGYAPRVTMHEGLVRLSEALARERLQQRRA
jgi:nucleoside-diphosphate-sugar epimerase